MKFNPSFLMISILIPFFFAVHDCHVISRRDADERAQKIETGDSMSPKFDLSKQKHFEGDIILPGKKPIDGIERSAVFNLWPYGKIPYVIDRSKFIEREPQLQIIADVMNDYKSKTCIEFIARTDETDYINITKTGSGCSSAVGRGKNQTVSLDDSCFLPRKGSSIKHELMHAAGFWHEQNRPDRDDYVKIYEDNIESGKEFNFKKKNLNEVQLLDTPYDLKSIMQYSWNFLAKDETKKTVTDINGNKVWNSDDFTLTDLLDLNRLYNCNEIIGSHRVFLWNKVMSSVSYNWARDCSIDGNNIDTKKLNSWGGWKECILLCAQNFACTFFTLDETTWVCTLKMGTGKEKTAPVISPLKGTSCGYIPDGNSYFEWNEMGNGENTQKWALNCDFPGMFNIVTWKDPNKLCSQYCWDKKECTSYVVRKDPGSGDLLCSLKSGKPIAVYAENEMQLCSMYYDRTGYGK